MYKKDEFHTYRGYFLQNEEKQRLSPSMEDYLEMIYRLSQDEEKIRISVLSSTLNVRPSSATKMVQRLNKRGYLHYEKYGAIQLTLKGLEIGRELLKRHETLEKFLSLLGVRENLLKDTEKIEHGLSQESLAKIFLFVEFLQEHEDVLELFHQFSNSKRTNLFEKP